jgi:hypothetical protein
MSGSSYNFTALFGLTNLTAPAGMVTHAVRFALSLATSSLLALNMPGFASQIGDFTAQAMTVDNSANAFAVTVAETSYGWTRIIPAGVTQTFQFPGVSQQNFTFTAPGTGPVVLSLYDYPAFPDSVFNEAVATGAPVTITGQPIAVTISGGLPGPAPQPYVAPAAGSIVTGGTAVTVFAAGAFLERATIQNPNSATESLFVNAVSVAAVAASGTNFELLPGQWREFLPTTNPITAIAATTAHAFSADAT